MSAHLFVFGPGYTARFAVAKAQEAGWRVTATYRADSDRSALEAAGIVAVHASVGALPADADVTHILVAAPPLETGDAMLESWESWLNAQDQLHSIIYLSSTNVYGNHNGAWVDENTPPAPTLERGRRRLSAEQAWQALAKDTGTRLYIFRLAGIYGPRRNALVSVKNGTARRVIKGGQVFSRIHVEDIAAAIWVAANSHNTGGIFNLADDRPCEPQLVIETAAALLDMKPPAAVMFEDADLSAAARSFYGENKRVKNDKIKTELGFRFKYPNYKKGLNALIEDFALDTGVQK